MSKFCRTMVFATLTLGVVSASWLTEASACGRCRKTRVVVRSHHRERSRLVVTSAPAAAVVAPTPQAPAKTLPTSAAPSGFVNDLNALRAQYQLPPVGEDANLSAWAGLNNSQQAARGMGHHVMGPARRQNAGWGSYPQVWAGWLTSRGHFEALLDPTITRVGLAGDGINWTFNAQ